MAQFSRTEIEKSASLATTSGFRGLNIEHKLLKAIDNLNYVEPTPIQKQAIPIGIEGRDIIAVAQTGTGKTIAFGVPLVQRLSQSSDKCGLVVVPTRELAYQIEAALKPISQSVHMHVAVIIGGVSMEPQVRALARRPQIIIATPGRLLDHLKHRTIDLSKIEILVLDEADRMLDMGFAPDVNRIISSLTREHQTMLFSATMPVEIIAITGKYMQKPVHIKITQCGISPEEISHEVFFVDNRDKPRLLETQLRQRNGSTLIFTRTKHGANKLTRNIKSMGHSVTEIHSNRSLRQRIAALNGFKDGQFRILVATDIAARGIDVTEIALVINYDLPSTSEDYVHRIGRTGRAGKNGHAMSFATFDQESEVRNIEKLMKMALPTSRLPFAPSQRSASIAVKSSINQKQRSRRFNFAQNPPAEQKSERFFGRKRAQTSGRSRRRR